MDDETVHAPETFIGQTLDATLASGYGPLGSDPVCRTYDVVFDGMTPESRYRVLMEHDRPYWWLYVEVPAVMARFNSFEGAFAALAERVARRVRVGLTRRWLDEKVREVPNVKDE